MSTAFTLLLDLNTAADLRVASVVVI